MIIWPYPHVVCYRILLALLSQKVALLPSDVHLQIACAYLGTYLYKYVV